MFDEINAHLASPKVPIDDYINQKRIDLGKALNAKKAIYLDTKYWIILRDAADGIPKNPIHMKLLSAVRALVRDGIAFCPLSLSAFIEFGKQPEQKLRDATARIVDELSLGITLCDMETLQYEELYSFFAETQKGVETQPTRNLIWNRPAFVLGVPVLSEMVPDPNYELAMQKAFYDHLGQQTFSMIMEKIGDGFDEMPVPPGSDPTRMNSDIADHASSLKSFEQTYNDEVRGVVDVVGEVAANILYEFGCNKIGQNLQFTQEEYRDLLNFSKNTLFHSLKKMEGKMKLRMMHIKASLYADLRWNKTQKFKPNDLIDFQHATEALAFCNVFLTERRLANAVTNRLHLDELYGCQVRYDESDALELLENMKMGYSL